MKQYGEWMGIAKIFGRPIDQKKWAAEIPTALIAKKGGKGLSGLRIYFDAGTADRYRFGPPNVEFSKLLKTKHIPHTFNLIKGGQHSWGSGSIQRAMVTSLQFVAKGFASNKKGAKTPKTSAKESDGAKETRKQLVP